ncbi:uncharacterized protein LOC132738720 [Ruditapes philippinarum]|uniref:uncharacterized protein LOC132738720 n=1 Tax=Ruditapes philippinarum TaxID=129788 RepID=UPI00295B6141|nr:uncharacterized protein LOC132738720 [Ruditapes philippinarum]
MVCGDSTIIAKVAMIVMIVSVVCSTIAIFTPYWNETEGANGDKIYTGLVVQCNNTLGVCVSVQDILDKYGNSQYYTDQLWTLSLAMIGWVFSIAAMVVLIVYACLPNKITAIVAIILCFLAGGCIIAAIIIYGVGFDSLVNSTLGWSFALDAAAGGLALVAMVIVIVNSCLIP